MLSDWRRNGTRFQFVTRVDGKVPRDLSVVRTPYGLEIIENCLACPHRQERLFCNLSDSALKSLAGITSSAAYPKGATLFVEGQPARGVFILCSGRVKLSTSSADGKTLILRISEPGEVLGLPATVTGTAYELTADVLEPGQANFIARNDFLVSQSEPNAHLALFFGIIGGPFEQKPRQLLSGGVRQADRAHFRNCGLVGFAKLLSHA